jgi:tagatose 6-phosphate kinase
MTAPGSEETPIVCTALNAAIDKRLHVAAFQIGQVHRATHMEATAGGKGLNVARVAKSLGASVLASGFAGGSNGAWMINKLDEIGIAQHMIRIGAETRICLNILDDGNGTSTEVLEAGPEIAPHEADLFLRQWRELCVPGRWLTLSGSLPHGLADDFYGVLIAEARNAGAFVVLDTSGVPLEQGVRFGPHTVKPNEEEFRQWSGADPRDEAAVRRMAAKLGQDGTQTMIVSLGQEGCIAAKPDGELWRAVPPAVRAVNPVGSGDAFVAGWTVACSRGLDLPEALRLAVAAGTANALTPGTGEVFPEDVADLIGRVHLERR